MKQQLLEMVVLVKAALDGTENAQRMEVDDAMEVDGEPTVYGALTHDESLLEDFHTQRNCMLGEIRENLNRANDIGTQDEIWCWEDQEYW